LKTKKLRCIITGRVLTATADYYAKKLEKAGTEKELHRTYICKEAKDLLVKGYTIENIRQQLGTEGEIADVPADIVKELTTNEYGLQRNTMFSEITSFTHKDTDPEVLDFINNL